MSEKSLNVLGSKAARRAFTMHERVWQRNTYVYPVVSRRSKGISIGVNLNPDKACNFDCIYCSVDRKVPGPRKDVDLELMRRELGQMVETARSGAIYEFDPFDSIPAALRRINDIAFSGDGEPTTFKEFGAACRIAAAVKDAAGLGDVKIVVITNATMFQRPKVAEALAFLDQHQGEIWAKLDAGTAEYYDLVDRTAVTFQRVLDNILACARQRPTVIQTLLMKVHGTGPGSEEIEAYCERLRDVIAGGGKIKLVQIYTVARGTTEPYATALSGEELEAIAVRVRAGAGVAVEVYP